MTVAVGLEMKGTGGTPRKLPSRHSSVLRKVKTRVFSSPWEEETPRSGLEVQALERRRVPFTLVALRSRPSLEQ